MGNFRLLLFKRRNAALETAELSYDEHSFILGQKFIRHLLKCEVDYIYCV